MRAYALQVQATEGVKPALIVVHYVQLLRDEEGDGRQRERNVSAAARGLKDVSGELEVPMLALVQLNRNRATRADKRPQLSDLRESGDLENTADSVLGVYRDEMEHPDSKDKGLAELSVLKTRQLGEEVGTMTVRHRPSSCPRRAYPWALLPLLPRSENWPILEALQICAKTTSRGNRPFWRVRPNRWDQPPMPAAHSPA